MRYENSRQYHLHFAAIMIIIIAAYAGVNKHNHCNDCNRTYESTQPAPLVVESSSFGLGYMLVDW